MKKHILAASVASLSLFSSSLTFAGGNLDAFNFIGQEVAPGVELVEVVPIRWDPRCSTIEYTLDTVLPNAGTADEISIEDTRAELQESLDQWNQIPTSFIEMNITEVRTLNNGLRSFDFINELTFETADDFTALASSPSMSLEQDTEFLVGDDIDGDGDSDVFDPEEAGRNTCFDFDDDGDIEFPAGFYLAGTILDNDVQFGQTVLWSTETGDDTAADIQAVATHEFGHSHGLAHTAINQVSTTDSDGSTMFPFIDTGDQVAEEQTRTLHEDDIAWSSFNYQEGSQPSGIGALQAGDQPFNQIYAVLTGEVTRGGVPIAGASVFAETFNRRERMVTAVSGTTTVLDLGPDGLSLAPIEIGIVNGNYEIPLLRDGYRFGVQALDGTPVTGSQVSITGNLGVLYGQQDFGDEFLSTRSKETGNENEPGRSIHVSAMPNRPLSNLDFVVNDETVLSSFVDQDFIGTGAVIGQQDVVYATRFSNAEVLAELEAGAVLTTATVNTFAFDASVVPTFARARLVSGNLTADGTIANLNPYFSFRQTNGRFFGAANDATTFFFNGARGLSRRLINELRRDPNLDLFVVVETENDFVTGPSGLPPLVGVDVDGPFGNSFLSVNGGNLEVADALNFSIQLRFNPAE